MVELVGDFKLIGLSFSVRVKVHLSNLMPEFRTIAMFVKLNVLKKISRVICKSVHSHLYTKQSEITVLRPGIFLLSLSVLQYVVYTILKLLT